MVGSGCSCPEVAIVFFNLHEFRESPRLLPITPPAIYGTDFYGGHGIVPLDHGCHSFLAKDAQA